MSVWRSALLSVASLVVFLGLAELIVRVIDPDLTLPSAEGSFRFDQVTAAERPTHVRDDRLGWRLAPDQSGSMMTNALGFRTPPFEPQPRPDLFRIVFAGDSNPLGYGIEDDAAPYPARVARLLDEFYAGAAGREIEVINLAVDGYSSFQVRLLLEEWIPRLAPDVLCVQVGFNDYCVAPVPDAEMSFARPWLLDALETSHAYRWLRRVLLGGRANRAVVRPPVPRVSPEAHERNLAHVVDLASAHGAQTILLTTPARPSVPLCINEIAVGEDGDREWITQDRWIKRRLVNAGVVPPDQPGHPAYARVVAEAMEAHPDWPILPFMLARAAGARGDRVAEAALDRRWRALDTERDVLARYANAKREVAAREDARVIDVKRALEAYASETGGSSDLYIDFVHLDPVGHVVVATEVVRVIVEEILGGGA